MHFSRVMWITVQHVYTEYAMVLIYFKLGLGNQFNLVVFDELSIQVQWNNALLS